MFIDQANKSIYNKLRQFLRVHKEPSLLDSFTILNNIFDTIFCTGDP